MKFIRLTGSFRDIAISCRALKILVTLQVIFNEYAFAV